MPIIYILLIYNNFKHFMVGIGRDKKGELNRTVFRVPTTNIVNTNTFQKLELRPNFK